MAINNAEKEWKKNMAEPVTIEWKGKSGRAYRYHIFPRSTTHKAIGGNYIFAKETRPGYFVPIYIGETGDLSSRFLNHHQNECIDKNGATHLHTHPNPGPQDRRDEETDLRRQWNTPCNEQ
jgi:hypothetical protein